MHLQQSRVILGTVLYKSVARGTKNDTFVDNRNGSKDRFSSNNMRIAETKTLAQD